MAAQVGENVKLKFSILLLARQNNLMRYLFSKMFADLFIATSLLLVFLLIVEDFHPGLVTLWLNLRLFLLVGGGAGILSLLFSKDRDIMR